MPEGWAWCRLGNIVLFERGITFPSSAKQLEKSDNNIPCIRTANVQEELTLDDLIFVDKTFIKNNIKKIVKEDDIIFSSANSRELVGKASYVNKIDIEMTFGGFVLVIRSKINKYVFYFLKREFLFGNFMGESTQTTNIANINTEKLSNILIPVPPQTEQTLIIERIKYWFKIIADFDKNIKNLETLVNLSKSKILDLAIHGKLVPQDVNDEPASVLLEKLRAEKEDKIAKGELKRDKNDSYIYKGSDNCYYEKFADGRTEEIDIPFEIPTTWNWCKLGSICDYGKCISVNANTLKSEDWILDLEDIEKDTGKIIAFKSFAERKSESTKHKFCKGQVLYSKLRPYLNKVVIAPKDGYCTSEILPLNFNNLLTSRYAQVLLMSSYFLGLVNMVTYGVKMPRLGTEDAKKMLIPIPPMQEQHRIIDKIDTLFARLENIHLELI